VTSEATHERHLNSGSKRVTEQEAGRAIGRLRQEAGSGETERLLNFELSVSRRSAA